MKPTLGRFALPLALLYHTPLVSSDLHPIAVTKGQDHAKLLVCAALWATSRRPKKYVRIGLPTGGIEYSCSLCFFVDYVFVDEHNRHKRLKGKRMNHQYNVSPNYREANQDSHASLQWLPKTKDQVRCRDDEYLAMFCMYSLEISMCPANNWTRRRLRSRLAGNGTIRDGRILKWPRGHSSFLPGASKL